MRPDDKSKFLQSHTHNVKKRGRNLSENKIYFKTLEQNLILSQNKYDLAGQRKRTIEQHKGDEKDVSMHDPGLLKQALVDCNLINKDTNTVQKDLNKIASDVTLQNDYRNFMNIVHRNENSVITYRRNFK